MSTYQSKRIQRIKDDRYYIKLKSDIILSYNDLFTALIKDDENDISSLLMEEDNIDSKIPGFFKTKFHQCSKNKDYVRLEIKPTYELPLVGSRDDRCEYVKEYKSIIEFFIKWLKMIDRKINELENMIISI